MGYVSHDAARRQEILWSKSRVALTNLKAGWPLLIIWVLGLACGVVTPLGVFVMRWIWCCSPGLPWLWGFT